MIVDTPLINQINSPSHNTNFYRERREELLRWYDIHARELPWRKDKQDPYRIWLSEIMLQQTTVVTVIPYFENFISRWPKVEDLANASLDDVLHAWQGLGYYARARNLHKCACVVAQEYGGQFPGTAEGLMALPGVGPYTAAAVASIGFSEAVVPVDGNVERVLSRLNAVEQPLPAAKAELKRLGDSYASTHRPGDFAQAFMELGAKVCRPKSPNCVECPWTLNCTAQNLGTPELFPRRLKKPKKPTRQGVIFWIEDEAGAVLMERREEKGLLGGMVGFPSTEWREASWMNEEATLAAPLVSSWKPVEGLVRHTFTHFHLELEIWKGEVKASSAHNVIPWGIWSRPEGFSDYALPTLMKKVASLAL